MKKILLIAMVMCIAIPALAVEISLVDNADGTGTIKYTAAAGEVVRGIAIIVDAGAEDITAVSGVNPEFNVFMDHASLDPDNYGIGDGNPIADPDAAGVIGLPATKIALCMGKVDESGNQAGAADDGTYDVATIAICGTVTITVDGLRGGVVGDNVVAGSVAGGEITCGDPPALCLGDVNGNGYIYTDDLGAMVDYLVANEGSYYYVDSTSPNWDPKADVNNNGYVYTDDLGAMVDVLVALTAQYYYQECPE